MNGYKDQIKTARDERETGDANKSLSLFLEIDKSQLEPNQLFEYLGELGLTYWHLENYDEAKKTFEELKGLAESLNNDSYKAVALRHLSRPEFNEGNPDLAVQYAQEARDLAKSTGRKDLVWFDHGVVSVLIFKGATKEEIKEWLDVESQDLIEMYREEKDKTAVWVWVTGLLIDRAKIYESKSDIRLALMIAKEFNLERRKEQIEKLMKEFE